MKVHPEVPRPLSETPGFVSALHGLTTSPPLSRVQVSQKELKEALRRQWSQLSDKRRLKWISKALELQKDYEVPGQD